MKEKFKGFTKPTYTITPNQTFDELLDILNGSELKVLLYIIRRTFGFKKENDNISLNQIVNGIKKKDGSVQDYGTGISLKSVKRAVKGLIEKNVILKIRRKDERYSEEKGYEATNYKLNIKIEPRYENYPLHGNKLSSSIVTKRPSSLVTKLPPPLVKKISPHIKNKQLKNIQQHVDVISKNREVKKTLKNLLDLKIDKNIAKSLIKKHNYKKINTYIKYLNYKLDKGFKPKDSIAAFLVDSIVNSYILPENFKKSYELEKKRKMSAKKCYESIKGDCIASETLNLYPYCPYCEKITKNIDQ